MTFHVLVCRQCGDGDLPMPFETAAARGKWAAQHTKATRHSRYFVVDQEEGPTRRQEQVPGSNPGEAV